eukprot:gene28765-31947_t
MVLRCNDLQMQWFAKDHASDIYCEPARGASRFHLSVAKSGKPPLLQDDEAPEALEAIVFKVRDMVKQAHKAVLDFIHHPDLEQRAIALILVVVTIIIILGSIYTLDTPTLHPPLQLISVVVTITIIVMIVVTSAIVLGSIYVQVHPPAANVRQRQDANMEAQRRAEMLNRQRLALARRNAELRNPHAALSEDSGRDRNGELAEGAEHGRGDEDESGG